MFLYSLWTRLPLITRQQIAREFGIPKKNSTHVVDNRIQDDGYVLHDVESALSIPNIQKYLNTDESDTETLWGRLVDKVEGREPVLETVVSSPNVTVLEKPKKTTKKPGRPKK